MNTFIATVHVCVDGGDVGVVTCAHVRTLLHECHSVVCLPVMSCAMVASHDVLASTAVKIS